MMLATHGSTDTNFICLPQLQVTAKGAVPKEDRNSEVGMARSLEL